MALRFSGRLKRTQAMRQPIGDGLVFGCGEVIKDFPWVEKCQDTVFVKSFDLADCNLVMINN